MSNWPPFIDHVLDRGFGGSRNGQSITGFVIHHVAGIDGLAYVASANNRNSHPTYHIANNGLITGIVHPSRRPYSTGGVVDRSAVTVEIDNSRVGGDWPVSDAALRSLERLIAWHAQKSPRAGIALNNPSVTQREFWVGWHQQYVATACPGPYILARLGQIVDNAQNINAPRPPAPAPDITNEAEPPPKPTPQEEEDDMNIRTIRCIGPKLAWAFVAPWLPNGHIRTEDEDQARLLAKLYVPNWGNAPRDGWHYQTDSIDEFDAMLEQAAVVRREYVAGFPIAGGVGGDLGPVLDAIGKVPTATVTELRDRL